MQYDFDEIIDRRNTNAVKIELCKTLFGTNDVIPLWVADMDFRTPDFILDAIVNRCKHPILGYTTVPRDYFTIITHWLQLLHRWEVKQEWLGFLPGIVPGIAFALNAFTTENDEVIVQTPVYPPFLDVPSKNNRKVVVNPLKEISGRFEMDFEDIESKITERTKLFILCNPQNPGGRTWDEETLKKLAEICWEHHVVVVSDEIHSDLVLPGNKHTPFASVSEEAAQNSITFMAPSKTFNMAGLISSFFVIPNENLRKIMKKFLANSELNNGNIFAYVAAKAAYENGFEWRNQLVNYIQGNVDFVVDYLKTNIPHVKPMIPQATFLIWLDCSGLKMIDDELQRFMIQKAGLGLNSGITFGKGGEQHLRLNIGCPRSVLVEALRKMKSAVDALSVSSVEN